MHMSNSGKQYRIAWKQQCIISCRRWYSSSEGFSDMISTREKSNNRGVGMVTGFTQETADHGLSFCPITWVIWVGPYELRLNYHFAKWTQNHRECKVGTAKASQKMSVELWFWKPFNLQRAHLQERDCLELVRGIKQEGKSHRTLQGTTFLLPLQDLESLTQATVSIYCLQHKCSHL